MDEILTGTGYYSSPMTNATILAIEGKHAGPPAFAAALRKKGFEVESVSSGSQALARLDDKLIPEIVVVNAASMRTTGTRICQALREKTATLPILLILEPNKEVCNTGANMVLRLPFTIQKLVNRIRNLLPGDDKNSIHAGMIRLDVENSIVHSFGKQSRLTPHLMRLLHTLLDHRGEVFERKALFSQVWETDYTEDTRTMDVHISWLRQAIEADPKNPKLLKTVRGVGYRLDV